MKRILTIAIALLTMTGSAWAQKAMTPPHVMVVPDNIYCKAHGYMFNRDGEEGPDYEKAMTEDPTLHSVLVQVAQLITDRNPDIVIIDLLEAIKMSKDDASMAMANGGEQYENMEEAIIRNSEADILIKVQYDLLKNGPQYQVSYTITGTDAYTNRMFAPIEGMGAPSTSANPVVLLREAVFQNMDSFLAKVLQYYQGMVTKGRMAAFDIKIAESAGLSMNSKVGDITLREFIEDFMFDNSVEGNGTDRVKSGATFSIRVCIFLSFKPSVVVSASRVPRMLLRSWLTNSPTRVSMPNSRFVVWAR